MSTAVHAGRTRPLRALHPALVFGMGFAQYLWLNFFYASVGENVARDLASYQGSIDGLATQPFDWDLLAPETIAHRTLVYGEYLASIVFQLTGALGGSATELHAATIVMLTLLAVFLQLNRSPVPSAAAILTFACPFLFANLLLGNTRQLWGCIMILLFYGHTPVFEYFRTHSTTPVRAYLRATVFLLLTLGMHVGSVLIFIFLLLIDYLASKVTKGDRLDFGVIWKHIGQLLAVGTIGIVVYVSLEAAEELWRLEAKFTFYSSETGLHSYPYLTGGFFYLVMLPLSLDVFFFFKNHDDARVLKFGLTCIWALLLLAILLPISHALDRVLTSLFLLAYVRRLALRGLHLERALVPLRLLAAVYYILTR